MVDNISSKANHFADDTSLFTVVYDVDIAGNKLNRDVEIISTWAYQWQMLFNPDKNKQAIQVIFSQKKDTLVHPPLFFSESEVVIKAEHKHLGMILYSKLTFSSHIKETIVKARRGIGNIRFLSKYVSRDALDQIYKLYVRPLNTLQRLLPVEHDEEQTQTRLTKNLAGKSFIIGDGTDVYVTFTNCKATKDHCTYTTKYHMNVLSVTI